jgi:2-polyprenyl-3-methyl-5-hydroxy-6-metoxy-1,4-benzoquinol methylase
VTLEKQQGDWDSIADFDALWGILSAEEKRGGKWDVNEFFKTGIDEIAKITDKIQSKGIILRSENALDFGCGVGRLTQAMTKYFSHCYGVDVSKKMIEMANKYNKFGDKCQYILNYSEDLSIFSNDFFDLIYSTITLQHISSNHIKLYITEFMRTLKPGGALVFQLPSYLPLIYRLQPRRRLFSFLSALGISQHLLFTKLKLNPIRMSYIAEKEMLDLVKKSGGHLLDIDKTKYTNGIISGFYFVSK